MKFSTRGSSLVRHLVFTLGFLQECLGKSLKWPRFDCSVVLGFPGGSAVKNPQETQEMRAGSQSWDDPLEKEVITHSSILAWRISGTEEPGRIQTMGSHRIRHDWGHAHTPSHTHTHTRTIIIMLTCKCRGQERAEEGSPPVMRRGPKEAEEHALGHRMASYSWNPSASDTYSVLSPLSPGYDRWEVAICPLWSLQHPIGW